MHTGHTVQIQEGFPEGMRGQVASLYWDAFKGKLGPTLRPDGKALEVLRQVIDPAYAICAFAGDGRLFGVAGLKTSRGAFMAPRFMLLARVYGTLGATWRSLLLRLLGRPVKRGTLLMDGIFVDERARGTGVGSRLLDAIKARASRDGCCAVSLAVIDTNSRARALYERMGFTPTGIVKTGPFRHVFGFREATNMVAQAR